MIDILAFPFELFFPYCSTRVEMSKFEKKIRMLEGKEIVNPKTPFKIPSKNYLLHNFLDKFSLKVIKTFSDCGTNEQVRNFKS